MHLAPACTHAYAITAAGAHKIFRKFQVCSNKLIDYQLRTMAKNKIFTWQKTDYRNVFDAGHTNGYFIQNWPKDLKLYKHLNV